MVFRMIAKFTAGFGAVAFATSMPAMAVPIDLGQVSIDWGVSGTNLPWAGTTNGFFLYREQQTTTGYYPDPGAYFYSNKSGTATITADPGRYITTASIGFSYGGFNNFYGGWSTSSIDWAINGGVFSDPVGTTGGPRCNDAWRYQCWQITFASGGHADSDGYLGYSNYFPNAGSDPTGFYTINASRFTVSVTQILEIIGGGPFNRGESMSFALFVQTVAGTAPPPISAAAPGALALLGLGLLGFGAMRRRRLN